MQIDLVKEIKKAIVIAINKEPIWIHMAVVIKKEAITGIKDTTTVIMKKDLLVDAMKKITEVIGGVGVSGMIIISTIDTDIQKENIIMTTMDF
jgi:hypothetical protein